MNVLKKLRKEKKMTQSQLAQLMNASQSAVAMWETGVALPRPDKLCKLAQILGVTVDQLLSDKEEEG